MTYNYTNVSEALSHLVSERNVFMFIWMFACSSYLPGLGGVGGQPLGGDGNGSIGKRPKFDWLGEWLK